jgi:glutamate synthase domain-containing protein 2/glutamate synthase domain-containing protein 1/glutamate synthase domain-containing protein 3
MQHDACGVGFIARVRGGAGTDIVRHGLTALVRLAHRGAPASLGSVDGCGLLTAIPWRLVTDALGRALPPGRTRALGMFFVDPADRQAAVALVERELNAAGAAVAWRAVPTDRSAVLRAQRGSTPLVLQAVVVLPDGLLRAEEALYRARLRVDRTAARDGVRLAIASLSTTTVVYKALVTPDALARFYPDLVDDRFASRFVVFHQRFSTNTSADWALAQPFRVLAHNGEINTIGGNRAWMRARLLDPSSLPGFTGEQPIASATSDSGSLDDAVELLRSKGYSTAHALSRLMPPSWERDRDLAPDVRAFYEFQSLVSEPWEGPSALAFADGRHVGAALDRNGFRSARVVRTGAGLVAVASEVGVLDSTEHEIVDRGRLGPGDMLLVDLDRGAILETNDIRRRLAFRRRYRRMVQDAVRSLTHAADVSRATRPALLATAATLAQRQSLFGCSREEIDMLLKPMAADGQEAVGSMGDDTPPAALSRRSRLFTDFFRQRFAQVTNPPVDPYRESAVMSLTTLLGAHGSYADELAPRPVRITLRSPILTEEQLGQLRASTALAPATISSLFEAAGGARALEQRLEAIADESCRAVEQGSALLILSDRNIEARLAPLPALLATAAVHQALTARGLRMRASLVLDTGDARDAHQLAALCAFGASAVCPSLGYDTVASLAPADSTGCDRSIARYRLALERGLLTILSKMGVCTFSSYCGAQLFEILGLEASVVDRFFPGSPSFPGTVGLTELAATVLARHAGAFSTEAAAIGYPGLHGYRRDGEYHATNPVVVRGLQKARNAALATLGPPGSPGTPGTLTTQMAETPAYETFKSHVYGRPPVAVRDLLEFAPERSGNAVVACESVEPVDDICKRFFASAMSVGALSPEAHRAVARAMNMLGARSNSGEGGEEPDRFAHPADGDLSRWEGSRTKQVASARFGVTPGYLRSADELQIKIAQGSKPGEGGQLPALKVVPHIARLRHAQPGTALISPPVHHDIYSIEDLAELIYDLRAFHPAARINVKLVASSGVGIIAAGVAKAGADAIQISGHDGGTGASPRASIKHAGLPWEIGLTEAHQALTQAGLRSRVVLQTDGGLKTGRDIAMAAALGAEEYGFGTAALVAIGCVMARQCHANTCPVGIATQREDLRNAFSGTPEMLVGYLRLVAGEVREILASLGLRAMEELVGRTDLLRPRADVPSPLVLDRLLHQPAAAGQRPAPASFRLRTDVTDRRKPAESIRARDLRAGQPMVVSGAIANTDRAFGADVAGAIAERYGDAGMPEGSVSMTLAGSAGQSFGAFSLPGMRLTLVGDANDGLGKGMHGGDIIVTAPARERGRPEQVLAGNAALYGATGGRVFIAGRVGERFGVRNSGATAVVEGVGDHACEYMTGGVVVVLGSIGRNFGSGMTGGVAYVCDRKRTLVTRSNPQYLDVVPLTAADQKIVRQLLETHEHLTGSRLARAILRHDRGLTTFRRVASTVAPATAEEAPKAETA